jgi:hypothetical protein
MKFSGKRNNHLNGGHASRKEKVSCHCLSDSKSLLLEDDRERAVGQIWSSIIAESGKEPKYDVCLSQCRHQKVRFALAGCSSQLP